VRNAIEFYNLGLGIYLLLVYLGVGDLLDALIKAFPEKPEVERLLIYHVLRL
jgi:GTP-binding protein